MKKLLNQVLSRSYSLAKGRNFRFSGLEKLIFILILVGIIYLISLWITNIYFYEIKIDTDYVVVPNTLLERALFSSEKALAQLAVVSRDLSILRREFDSFISHGAFNLESFSKIFFYYDSRKNKIFFKKSDRQFLPFFKFINFNNDLMFITHDVKYFLYELNNLEKERNNSMSGIIIKKRDDRIFNLLSDNLQKVEQFQKELIKIYPE